MLAATLDHSIVTGNIAKSLIERSRNHNVVNTVSHTVLF